MSAITTDHNQPLQPFFLNGCSQVRRTVLKATQTIWIREWVAAVRCAKHGASAVEKSLAAAWSQIVDSPRRIKEAVERIFDSHDLPVKLTYRILDHCTDDGIESGCVAASGKKSYSMSCHERPLTRVAMFRGLRLGYFGWPQSLSGGPILLWHPGRRSPSLQWNEGS